MKKSFLLFLFITTSLMCNSQEYTKFMGISMDKPVSAFAKILTAKGMKIQNQQSSGDDFQHTYFGKLDDDNCNVLISENTDNSSINHIDVSVYVDSNDTIIIKRKFLNEYKKLSEIYGKPIFADTKDNFTPRFTFHNYLVWYDEYRILLRIDDYNSEGKSKYYITTTYYSKPIKE